MLLFEPLFLEKLECLGSVRSFLLSEKTPAKRDVPTPYSFQRHVLTLHAELRPQS